MSWTHHKVSQVPLPSFGLDLKICNSSAWDLPLETSWKYYGSSAGDGEAIVNHFGQNQREKSLRKMSGSLVPALDRKKSLSSLWVSSSLHRSLWGHVFVVTWPAILLHWVWSPLEWTLLKKKNISQRSYLWVKHPVQHLSEKLTTVMHFSPLVQKSWNKHRSCYLATAEGAGT